MLERYVPIFRVVCAALAGLIVLQVSRLLIQKDPLRELSLPTPFVVPKASEPASKKETNAAAGGTNAPKQSPGPAAGKRGPGGPPQGPGDASLPAPVQARVDRIIQSEILGAIMRPMPMALLGIAGREVFLRAPNGQTGMVHEGEELGGVKIIRIGANRVLVEQDKQQKELTIFSGFGGETLLSK